MIELPGVGYLGDKLVISNPKQHSHSSLAADERLFPYYAGYSHRFADELLSSAGLDRASTVLDPWNGSGTTTFAASKLGLRGVGFDLNPAMVIVAKASLLSPREVPSLPPLAESLVEQMVQHSDCGLEHDPLSTWFSPSSTKRIRQLESEINRTLVSHRNYLPLVEARQVNQVSSLAAFFYVCLFRTIRRLLSDFIPTNPTWVKKPALAQARKNPSVETISAAFKAEVDLGSGALETRLSLPTVEDVTTSVSLGSSEELPLRTRSVDFALSSPPYCTRIDYAVATALELATLRFDNKAFDTLRRGLMGTSTVEATHPVPSMAWGTTCFQFLEAAYSHESKASTGYYFKSHLQYFSSLYRSLEELVRVLKPRSHCALVIQDSHYKEIHNNVPRIAVEMAEGLGLGLRRQVSFPTERSMVVRNTRARKYLERRRVTESVVYLESVA